ncbi:MAG: BC1872 family protein [bacterium]
MDINYIFNLKAGKELDLLIAKKIMGSKIIYVDFGNILRPLEYCAHPIPFEKCKRIYNSTSSNIPPYSTDIGAAWEVLNLIIQKKNSNYTWTGPQFNADDHKFKWFAKIVINYSTYQIQGYTAPEVICKSALLINCEEKIKTIN